MKKLTSLTAAAAVFTLATAAQAGVISYVLSGTFEPTFENTSSGPTVNLDGANFIIDFTVDTEAAPISTFTDGTPGQETSQATFNSPFGQLTVTGSPGGTADGAYAIVGPTVTLINNYGTNPENDQFRFDGDPNGLSDNIFAIQMTTDLGGQGVYSGSTEPSPVLIVTGVVLSEAPPVSPDVGPGATDPTPNSQSFIRETFFFGAPDLAEYVPQNAAMVPEVNSAPGLAAAALALVWYARRRKAKQAAATTVAA